MGKFELTEESFLEWFAQKLVTNPNIAINGPLLCKKASDLASDTTSNQLSKPNPNP